ncbi:MAG: ABC transporter ATP-binding protein, partial [Chloroflexota bacterium]|nr:ABC transporter ATP-binding protein [Chloroflexota bacterium]
LVHRDPVVDIVVGAGRDDAETLLARHGEIRDVEQAVVGRTTLRLAVADDEVIAMAVDDLVRAGVPVYAVTPHGLTLEELFFEIVSAGGRRLDE